MRPNSPLTLALTLTLTTACAVDQFQTDDDFGEPPNSETFDPDDGGDWSGSSSTTEEGDAGDGDGDEGPAECDDANKRCEHEFSLPDMSYASVELIGDFAADGWTNGETMSLDGETWRVVTGVPWDTPVEYKFRINGGEGYIPDPNNPNSVDDGFGGLNSVLDATTCEDWDCDPGNIGDFDWRDAVIYFVFVDRFYNGDMSNDGPIGVEAPADWQGGDWAGVMAKIDEGYFDDLGVNCLWLSVPLDNTQASGAGIDGHQYSAYHGYWPQNFDQTEEHFGTLEELQALVELAHAHDIKVLFDYAMNHAHSSAPVYAQNPDWFWPNDNGQGGNCVCGEGCAWDGADGRRCWFTPYLPDFNFTNAAARDFSVGNAMQWIADTGVDGFRLDAVKHIEDQWLLDLRARVSAEVEPLTGEHFYMVGETFTGDQDLINYYVNSSMLDGQFDFPLRMELANKLIMRNGAMSDLAAFMDGNDDYYGAGIMSTFIGNHDIPRIIHLAEDQPVWASEWTDGKDLAWDNISLPDNVAPFERVALGFTLILTTPGAPLIYYGDEVGMAGAGDPDNRRFMQWAGYSAGQDLLLDHVMTLNAIRAEQPALRRGDRTTLSADADTFVYEMSLGSDSVYVAINRADATRTAGGLPGGSYQDLLTGDILAGPSVELGARTSVVLRPE
ncbi:alpha-amylase family glycosyl hydrolase [Enhygromyxa salina]|uniref:alpha-amylase family glycosyl hydrolase n=1 Tax=Enhygromyxa salina TaxID=215803 RepID=UPI0015E5AE69|nr:alpha-amylase family glycosyl hydrolase [Enhygromyxa salina]